MDNNPLAKAKLDGYAEELLKKIEDEKISVHPTVWALMNHVLSNRIHAINLALGDFEDTPGWILKTASCIMTFLYKITGGKGNLYPITYYTQKSLNNTRQMREFLDRLREVTGEKREF